MKNNLKQKIKDILQIKVVEYELLDLNKHYEADIKILDLNHKIILTLRGNNRKKTLDFYRFSKIASIEESNGQFFITINQNNHQSNFRYIKNLEEVENIIVNNIKW